MSGSIYRLFSSCGLALVKLFILNVSVGVTLFRVINVLFFCSYGSVDIILAYGSWSLIFPDVMVM